jgi:hypothetical protein
VGFANNRSGRQPRSKPSPQGIGLGQTSQLPTDAAPLLTTGQPTPRPLTAESPIVGQQARDQGPLFGRGSGNLFGPQGRFGSGGQGLFDLFTQNRNRQGRPSK